MNVFGADIVEIDAACKPTLMALWPGDSANISICDMMTIKLQDLHDADGFVAGFPCPITSSLGHQKGLNDPRSKPFLRGIQMMKELGKRGGGLKLKWYILEHVTGSLQKTGGRPSFADTVNTELENALPHF